MSTALLLLGGIATLLTVLSLLGGAIAVYSSSATKARLELAEGRNAGLLAEITDGERREGKLQTRNVELTTEVGALKDGWGLCRERLRIVEDVLSRRSDDDQVREGIAALKVAVDSTVTATLRRIEQRLDKWEQEDKRPRD